jgi:multiple sugar transport system permease protein
LNYIRPGASPARGLRGLVGRLRRNWSPLEIIVLLGAIICLSQVILIFVTAFKPDSEIIHYYWLLPHHWTLANFREVLGRPEEIPIFRWLFNSVFISSSITILVLTVDSMAAFALSRLNLPGGKWIFAMILATMMVPGQILLVPVYLILSRLHLIDTPWALIIPAGAGAFGVFLLHQFMKGIPKELEEAAMLDGCSTWQIYRHVMLPLSKPALATLAIFVFVGSWNEFTQPLVFLDSVENYTLPVGIALFQSSYVTEYGLLMAASVICTLPIIVIFMMFHKHIIAGIATAGLKD